MKNPQSQFTRNKGYSTKRMVWICSACGNWMSNQGKIVPKERVCGLCMRKGTLIKFDSTVEGQRYAMLAQSQRAGDISGLVCHPTFPVVINGQHVCKYVADFQYYDIKKQLHVEDVKPKDPAALDPVFKLKRKLIEAIYGFEIELVN